MKIFEMLKRSMRKRNCEQNKSNETKMHLSQQITKNNGNKKKTTTSCATTTTKRSVDSINAYCFDNLGYGAARCCTQQQLRDQNCNSLSSSSSRSSSCSCVVVADEKSFDGQWKRETKMDRNSDLINNKKTS